MSAFFRFFNLLLLATVLIQCSKNSVQEEFLFEKLPPSITGVTFENMLTPSEEFNMYIFRNFYNGGGVAIGDINGDGLPDIYLTGNQVSNRLYLNRGNYEFKDITEQAGLRSDGVWTTGVSMADVNGDGLLDIYITKSGPPGGAKRHNELFSNNGDITFTDRAEEYGLAEVGLSTSDLFFDYDGDGALDLRSDGVWTTGVSMADVNGDGLLDIYITKSGPPGGAKRHNELFINNGDLTFTDRAEEYGLAEVGLSTHALFFDYDGDGDLDMYLLNNSFDPVGGYEGITGEARNSPDPMGGSKLFRNDGGVFTDVSSEAGIYTSRIGFGLSASVSDVNRDGLPDIYVANDFFERDYLYLNNGDGTFREVLEEQMGSISLSSMGSDIADLTNNGWPDIYVAAMLSFDERRRQVNMSYESYDLYSENVKKGFHHQFTRNTLQRNNGDGTYSEVGRLTGTEATDWSWAVLIADFDNNGHQDIYVTNGIYKDLLDQDFLEYAENPVRIRELIADSAGNAIMSLMEKIPSEPVSNVLFSGEGDLVFRERAEEWGLGEPGFSSGAAWEIGRAHV